MCVLPSYECKESKVNCAAYKNAGSYRHNFENLSFSFFNSFKLMASPHDVSICRMLVPEHVEYIIADSLLA